MCWVGGMLARPKRKADTHETCHTATVMMHPYQEARAAIGIQRAHLESRSEGD